MLIKWGKEEEGESPGMPHIKAARDARRMETPRGSSHAAGRISSSQTEGVEVGAGAAEPQDCQNQPQKEFERDERHAGARNGCTWLRQPQPNHFCSRQSLSAQQAVEARRARTHPKNRPAAKRGWAGG